MADLLGFRVTGAVDNKAAATGSGGWPFAHVLTVSTTDAEADYTNIADAITAAAAGDVILLDAETYGPLVFTLNKDVTLKGSARGETILTNNSGTTTLTVSTSGARVEDITVINSSTGNAVDVTAATATLERVIAQTTAAAGSVKSAIATTSATKCTLIACEATASGGSLSNAGLLVTSTAICDVIGGRYNGSTIDFSCASNNTLNLFDPVSVNATLVTGGTIRGEAFDQYGRRLRVKPIGVSDGRLTLTTAVPVTTADVTAATTIYYTPYIGGKCEVYNGSFWIEAPFTQVSLSLSGFTADKNSDVWIYDNAGVLALERTEWTNDTTRATALAYQDGRYVKSGTTTRLYLGTFRTTAATGECEDSLVKRYVWNNYNRVPRALRVANNTSHTYSTATWRAFNNDQANSDFEFIVGVAEQSISPVYGFSITESAGNTGVGGIGYDVTNAQSGEFNLGTAATFQWVGTATGLFTPAEGYHFICLVEISLAGTPTFSGAYTTCLLDG